MGRMYAVPFNGTVTSAGGNADVFSVQPADDKPVRVWGFSLGQISEVGDAAEEGLRFTLSYLPATFTVGSGGAAVTAKTPQGDRSAAVWGATVRTNDTTVATTTGTLIVDHECGWNERGSPYDWFYPDERFVPVLGQTAGEVLRMETTPADDFTGVMTLWFEEGVA